MRRLVLPTIAFAALILLAGPAAPGQPAIAAGAAGAPVVPLRVMTLNIFYGGDEINLASGNWCNRPDGCTETLAAVVDVIRASGADVVGLEEAERNTRPIAEALGWYYSERTQVISRYPLIDPPDGGGVYLFAQITPGMVVAVASLHLPADPYGPYLVRDGAALDEVLALENSLRMPAIQDALRVLPRLAAAGIPVFLVGDFNTPSHLDWTAGVATVRPEVRYPVAWPVGVALAKTGFRDSYRVVHPDPIAVPGFTWTPGGPESIPDEVHDRIDWVLAAGPATPRASVTVGESGGPDVGIAVDPYPTDHRGVVTTFDVTPGVAPVLVAVAARRLSVGDDLAVLFHAPGRRGEQVGVVPAGGAGPDALVERSTGGGVDGTVLVSTAGFDPGAYEAVLIDNRGRILSRSPFWLYPPGVPTIVATSKSEYAEGEPIDVSWSNAPGMRWDWLGIYVPGDSDASPVASSCNAGCYSNGRYLIYEYTHTAIEGTTTFTAQSPPGVGTWPLSPGTYEIRLLVDDGYRSVASSPSFKVRRP